MFVVRVQMMLEVKELKLGILGLFRFDHDLHLTTVFAYKLCCFLDYCVQSVTGRLKQ